MGFYQSRGAESPPQLLPTLFWVQPRTLLDFWAASAHGQVTLSSSSTTCSVSMKLTTQRVGVEELKVQFKNAIQQLEEADEIT